MGEVMYDVRVLKTLQETIESLKAAFVFSKGLKGKPEIFVFGFDGAGTSILIRKELKMFSNRISKTNVAEEDESDEEDENSIHLITPSYLLLKMSTSMTLYAKATSQKTCWSSSTNHYLPSDGESIKKHAIASKSLVNVSVLHNLVKDV
jgi:hypothetical protein